MLFLLLGLIETLGTAAPFRKLCVSCRYLAGAFAVDYGSPPVPVSGTRVRSSTRCHRLRYDILIISIMHCGLYAMTQFVPKLKVVGTTAVSFQVFKVSSRAASNGRAHALNSIRESYLQSYLQSFLKVIYKVIYKVILNLILKVILEVSSTPEGPCFCV